MRTNASALILKEMVIPKSSVIKLASSFCAVLDRLFNTPHSLTRLPNIRKPTSATDDGEMKPTMMVTMMGNAIFVPLDTETGLYFI